MGRILVSLRQKVYLAYDVNRSVCIMQGGQAAGWQLPECWEYDGTNWRAVGSTPTPTRGVNCTAFDRRRGVTVVFGGWNGRILTDTWEYGPVSTAVFSTYGAGCSGSAGVLRLSSARVPALGSAFSVDVANLPPSGGAAFMILGFDNYRLGSLWLPLDLGVVGITGCTSYVAPLIVWSSGHTGGTLPVAIPIPNDPLLSGLTFYCQGSAIDAGAPNGIATFSNAGEGVIR